MNQNEAVILAGRSAWKRSEIAKALGLTPIRSREVIRAAMRCGLLIWWRGVYIITPGLVELAYPANPSAEAYSWERDAHGGAV